MRIGWGAAAVLAAGIVSAGLAGVAAGAAPKNSYSAGLAKMPAAERAAQFAAIVGYWCVGTETFLMGVASSGPEAGNAYWSVACLDGNSYAIQIDPMGRAVAVPCGALADAGQGRECFKKF